MDDTQAYIRMDCKGGNPVSAPGVGGNGPWKKIVDCSPHLEVAFRPYVSGDLNKKKKEKKRVKFSDHLHRHQIEATFRIVHAF